MRVAFPLLLLPFSLAGCSTGAERPDLDQARSVFHNPYGYSPFLVTNATTEHPPYIICNGEHCAYLDRNGNYTRMSKNERRDWRERIRLAEEDRGLKEDEQFAPPQPIEDHAMGRDADPVRVPVPVELGETMPD